MALNAEEALKAIMAGNTQGIVDEKNRKRKLVEKGNRIPHAFIEGMVKKLREKKVNEKAIVDKILFLDDLAEKGELIQYLSKQKIKK